MTDIVATYYPYSPVTQTELIMQMDMYKFDYTFHIVNGKVQAKVIRDFTNAKGDRTKVIVTIEKPLHDMDEGVRVFDYRSVNSLASTAVTLLNTSGIDAFVPNLLTRGLYKVVRVYEVIPDAEFVAWADQYVLETANEINEKTNIISTLTHIRADAIMSEIKDLVCKAMNSESSM